MSVLLLAVPLLGRFTLFTVFSASNPTFWTDINSNRQDILQWTPWVPLLEVFTVKTGSKKGIPLRQIARNLTAVITLSKMGKVLKPYA